MKHLFLAIALLGMMNTQAMGCVSLPNEADVIDSEDYFSKCESSNPDSESVCEDATAQYEKKLDAPTVDSDEVAQND